MEDVIIVNVSSFDHPANIEFEAISSASLQANDLEMELSWKLLVLPLYRVVELNVNAEIGDVFIMQKKGEIYSFHSKINSGYSLLSLKEFVLNAFYDIGGKQTIFNPWPLAILGGLIILIIANSEKKGEKKTDLSALKSLKSKKNKKAS